MQRIVHWKVQPRRPFDHSSYVASERFLLETFAVCAVAEMPALIKIVSVVYLVPDFFESEVAWMSVLEETWKE